MRKALVLLAFAYVVPAIAACTSGKASVRFPDPVVTQLDVEVGRQMREQNLPGVVVAISVPGHGDYIAVKATSTF